MIARLHLNEQENPETLALPNGQTLPLKSIVYTSFSGHYVTIHLISGEQLKIRYTQREWEGLLLTFPGFILCTKGMIVRLEEVERLEETVFLPKIMPTSQSAAENIRKSNRPTPIF